MRKTKKMIALCCAGALAFCFASCKADTDADITTTTEPLSVSQVTEATDAATDAATDPAAATDAATDPAPAESGPKTNAEIIALYNDAYNKTKAAGSLKGTTTTTVGDVILSGKKNAQLNGIVQGIVASSAKPVTGVALMPSADGFATSGLTESDVSSITCEDKGSSYLVKITPIDTENTTVGGAGDGKLFDVLPDIVPYFSNVPGFKWTEGDASQNLKIAYSGSSAEVTIDKASGMITSGTYSCKLTINIDHAQALGFLKLTDTHIAVDMTTKYPG